MYSFGLSDRTGACSIAGKQGDMSVNILTAMLIEHLSGLIHLGAYSAAKFAIRGLTHVMCMWYLASCFAKLLTVLMTLWTTFNSAKELKEHNITVNAYAPCIIDTAMSMNSLVLMA